ncbi:glycosyltransferase [Thermotoga sp. SG1]|uniref:glycosyltransferase n=1 Tax=Thermotoga sp. SG1 TaxID=126739 RepID=UPI000CC2080C|nr:glycosyltransferase [Thermotoga sp. SG1]PLV56736.1 glycosyl transferase family 1 [Thermotoga sp. SG1]
MKVLVIGYMHSRDDKRVFRTVQALSKKYEVIYQYRTEEEETSFKENNIKYVSVRCLNKGSVLQKAVERKSFDEEICRLIKTEDYDIIYMHHFPATSPLKPFLIAKKRGKKIVYDVHEYHPQNFLNTLPSPLYDLKEFVMWRIFRKQLKLADLCIFVSEETRNDVVAKAGLNPEKTFIVPNYASLKIEPDPGRKRREIVMVGKTPRGFTHEKRLIKALIERGFSFRIIGMDSKVFSDVSHTYTSFLPYERMMEEISRGMFSLVSYSTIGKDYKNYLYALPHKFYDSIAAGTPVVVKESFVSMAKIVKELKIGVVIDPSNTEDSLRKIESACQRYEELLENIKKHQDLFIWDERKEEEFLKKIIEVVS